MTRMLLAIIFFLLPRALFACQCLDRPTLSVAAVRSDVVAVGRIAQLTHIPGLSIGGTQLEKPIIAKLIVDTSWKQSVSTLEIVTSFSDCDYREFVVGGRYLVFAEYDIARLGKHDGMVWAPRCLPTQRRERVSSADLRDLGEPMFSGESEVERAAAGPQPRSVGSRVITFAGIIVVFVVASAALIRYRR